MNEEEVYAGVILLVIAAIIAGGLLILTVKSCESRWEGTYQTDWSMLGGCRVKMGDKFLPEANVREIER